MRFPFRRLTIDTRCPSAAAQRTFSRENYSQVGAAAGCSDPLLPAITRSTLAERLRLTWVACFLLLFSVGYSPQASADTVTVASSGGTMRLSGHIVDYTGERLELEMPDGGRRTIPAAQVIGIATDWVADHSAADRALSGGQYAEALILYTRAIEAERRPWVRRMLTAQIVRCRSALGQTEQAVESFLVLVQADQATPYFDCIPLAWLAWPPEPNVELAAQRWISRPEPTSRLLGASHLLASPQRAAAIAILGELCRDADPRIAWAARAQQLRLQPAAPRPTELEQRQREFADAPAWLQPGLSYVLGRAWAIGSHFDEAAILFLRCGLTEPYDRALAAQAMLEAGLVLSRAGAQRESDAVWREMAVKLGDQRRAVGELASRDPQRWGRPATIPTGPALAPLPLAQSAKVAAVRIGSGDGDFLEALRERGLSRLAARYCEAALASPDLPPPRRAELCIELVRSLTIEALGAPPAEREAIWSRADQAVAQFVDRHSDDFWALPVRMQGLMAHSARAELAFHEAVARNGAPTWLDRAKESLRAALKQWEQLATELEDRQRNAMAGSSRAPASPAAIASLRRTAACEIARIYRLQAECYPAASDDRTHALLMAAKLLLPLAQSDADHSLQWRSRLALVACYRMLSDFESAGRAIEMMRQSGLGERQELALRAEEIRLALAQRRLDDALALADGGVPPHASSEPEFDLAQLETYLVARRRAADEGDAAKAAQWLERADERLRDIEQRYGPAWRRRGEMLVTAAVGAGETTDAAMLVRIAENAYHSEQYDEAIAAYDRAAAAALAAGEDDRAFELGFTAATIAHRLGRHEDACVRYRQIARKHSRHAKAPEAHLLAVGHAAELARNNQEEPLQQYRALLEEHAQEWPQSPTADEAHWRLARLYEYRQQWEEAAEAYRRIVHETRRPAAVAAAERCTNLVLAQLKNPADRAAAATSAVAWFEGVAAEAVRQSPPVWRPEHCWAALAAARIRLAYLPGEMQQAAALLHQALGESRDTDASWRAAAESALIVAAAAAGRGELAIEALSGWSARPIDELETLLGSLAELGRRAQTDARRAIADVELKAIDMLQARRGELSAEARRRLDRMRADALLTAGRHQEALAAFSSLVAADDSDAAAHEGCARALAASGKAADWERVLKHWGLSQKGRPHGSPDWLRAQLAMAELELRLGRKAAGAQRLRLIERQYADSLTPETRDQLQRLLHQSGL